MAESLHPSLFISRQYPAKLLNNMENIEEILPIKITSSHFAERGAYNTSADSRPIRSLPLSLRPDAR
jgi:hypothetical protein